LRALAGIFPDAGRRTSLTVALAAVLAALAGQWLIVSCNFGGAWTGLFHTGEALPATPELTPPPQARFPGLGYDGQFYRYVAHDPLLLRGLARFVDEPRLRARRVLVPGLAYALAGGTQKWIDAAYIAVVLAFLFAGVYWTAEWARFHERSPAWGLGFLLVPAALISLERMTVDIALASLCAGFALYAATEAKWKLLGVAALAPLVRETGLLLPAAWGLFSLRERRWRQAAWAAAACLPALAWFAYVHSRTGPDPVRWVSFWPLAGLWSRTVHVVVYPVASWKQQLAAALDYLAVLGVWAALGLAAWLLWTRRQGAVETGLLAFCAVPVFLSEFRTWTEAYAFGRFLSPLLLWLAMLGLAQGRWLLAAPLAMTLPRVAAQIASHLPGVAAALLGG